MKNELVSMVIPVYNTPEHILRKTVSTIAGQTYRQLEVLFVDDGSSGRTVSVLEELVRDLNRKHLNAKVLHQLRGGVSRARNFGKREADGNWICFVDSDDLISRYYVEGLLKAALQYGSPIAACGFKRINSPSEMQEEAAIDEVSLYQGADAWKHTVTGYLWNKMFRRDVIENVDFDEALSVSEDALFVNQVFERMPVVAVTQRIMYWYCVNPFSATAILNTDKCRQAMRVAEYILNISQIKNDADLSNEILNWNLVWNIRYVEALAYERTVGYRREYKRCKQFHRKSLSLINTKYFGNYEKTASFILSRMPELFSIPLFRMWHTIKVVRAANRKP